MTPNTISYGNTRKEIQISLEFREHSFKKSSCRRFHFVKLEAFEVYSGTPIRTFSLDLFHILSYYIYSPRKSSGTRFCPLKIKITQIPNGFRLKNSV